MNNESTPETEAEPEFEVPHLERFGVSPHPIGYPCTNFIAPTGKQEQLMFKNMRQEAFEWITTQEAKMSCEDLGTSFALYLDVGLTYDNDPEEDPNEAIVVIPHNSNPFDAVDELVACAKELLECQ